MAFLNDGFTVAAGTARGYIFVYDLRQGMKPKYQIIAHEPLPVRALAFQRKPKHDVDLSVRPAVRRAETPTGSEGAPPAGEGNFAPPRAREDAHTPDGAAQDPMARTAAHGTPATAEERLQAIKARLASSTRKVTVTSIGPGGAGDIFTPLAERRPAHDHPREQVQAAPAHEPAFIPAAGPRLPMASAAASGDDIFSPLKASAASARKSAMPKKPSSLSMGLTATPGMSANAGPVGATGGGGSDKVPRAVAHTPGLSEAHPLPSRAENLAAPDFSDEYTPLRGPRPSVHAPKSTIQAALPGMVAAAAAAASASAGSPAGPVTPLGGLRSSAQDAHAQAQAHAQAHTPGLAAARVAQLAQSTAALASFIHPGIPSAEEREKEREREASAAFQAEFVKNLVSSSLEEFRYAIHRDIHNMHLELLRQFQIQRNELEASVTSLSLNESLVDEIARLRHENSQLRASLSP
jgi:hypothetical protein